jgi:hypothetical protein
METLNLWKSVGDYFLLEVRKRAGCQISEFRKIPGATEYVTFQQ